jgi:integrase/recombinase XerD
MTITDAVDRFLNYLSVGLGARTVKTYEVALHRFREYLEQADAPPSETPAAQLTVDRAIDFVHWLIGEHFRGQEVPKSTLRTYLSSLSRFYAYVLRERLADISASDHQRMKDTYRDFRKGYHRPLPKLPPEEAVQQLIAAARSQPVNPQDPRSELGRLRDVAMLEMLRATGMRVGELVSLRRGDVDYRNQAAVVRGKGGRERVVYLDDRAWQALSTYLQARQDGARGRALYQLPVLSRHDRGAGGRVLPLSTNTVRRVFADCHALAGLEQPLTPHSLRHAFATRVLEATGDLAVVQDLLGHSSPATTRIYAKVTSQRLREAHRRAFEYGKE